METSKAIVIGGTILGGGSLTGLAIKYFPASNEESAQSETKVKEQYIPRKITKQEVTDYQAKFQKWEKDNGGCNLLIKTPDRTVERGINDLSEGDELDLNRIAIALESEEAKNKCKDKQQFMIEKEEGKDWVFLDYAEIYRKDIENWISKNGGCKVKISEEGKEKEISDFDKGEDLQEIRGELTEKNHKQACSKKTEGHITVLFFSKTTDDPNTWSFTERTDPIAK